MENKGCFTPTLRYVAAFFLACLFAIILFPIFARQREPRHPNCQSNLKQIALGIFQYTQDYDERYPIVSVHDTAVSAENPYGWADALQPYLKSTQIFQCSNETTIPTNATSGPFNGQPNPTAKDYTDYWYNARLNGLEQKAVHSVAGTLMMGDGNDGTDATNARYSLKDLPVAWRSDADSPAHRHVEGANYAFTDGHVKWLKPEQISGQKPNPNNATFAVK